MVCVWWLDDIVMYVIVYNIIWVKIVIFVFIYVWWNFVCMVFVKKMEVNISVYVKKVILEEIVMLMIIIFVYWIFVFEEVVWFMC